MIYLKELNFENIKEEYEFVSSLKNNENGFENPCANMTFDEFSTSYFKERMDYSKGLNLKEGHVSDSHMFLWDDDHIIGLFKIRHYLNDFLKNGPGHIGYIIKEEHRGKGYATIGLKLAIEYLINLPDFKEDEVYLSCNINNPGSLKVMLKNGGYIDHSDDKEHYVRIKA